MSIVAQQVEKVEKLRAENNATRTVMIYRMHLLLTPEQRVKVDAMRARMETTERKTAESGPRRQALKSDDTPARLVTADFDHRTFHLEAVREQDRIIPTRHGGVDPRGRRPRGRAAAGGPIPNHVKALIEQAMVRLKRRRQTAHKDRRRRRARRST